MSHPQPWPGTPLARTRPRARARGGWKPRPPGGPSSGKVSATFSGSGRDSRRPAGAPPPVSSDRSPAPRRTRGSRAAARSPVSAACPSVRAGPARRPLPARRRDPPPPPAHPERHHELALQEEKQRQIQPHRADPEVRRRRMALPGRPRETRAPGGALGGEALPGARGGTAGPGQLPGAQKARPRGRGAERGVRDVRERGSRGTPSLSWEALPGWGWLSVGGDRRKTRYLAPGSCRSPEEHSVGHLEGGELSWK